MSSYIAPLALAAFVCAPLTMAAQDVTSVHVRMKARFGTDTFVCGREYTGVGSAGSTIEATEFKFYVSDIRLLSSDGRETPVKLTQDGLWQNGSTALIDLEDGSGACSNGNADVRDVIEGTVPPGNYTGVRFVLGVPFERNHQDLTTQPSPLSLTRMFWAWNSGYKFLRLDLKTKGAQNWMVHLGSTECTPAGSSTVVPTSCKWANRPTITLDGYDPTRDVVELDVAELLRRADVSVNQPRTASGCMSAQNDHDCTPVFVALGLPHASAPAGVQRVFRVARGAISAPAGPGDRP